MREEFEGQHSSTGILVRAFLAAFILSIFITPTDASFGESQLTIVIFLIGLLVAFNLLRTTERFLFLSFILIAIIFLVALLGGGAVGFQPVPSGQSGFYAILLSILAVLIAFVWPKRDEKEELEHGLQVDDHVILIVGYAQVDPASEDREEVRAKGTVIEVEEQRVKVHYRDPFGEMKEEWIDPDLVEKIEAREN